MLCHVGILVVCVCVCFCSPDSIPCLNYEVVGFQPQEVDTPKTRRCASPQYIFKPPTPNMHARDDTNEG